LEYAANIELDEVVVPEVFDDALELAAGDSQMPANRTGMICWI